MDTPRLNFVELDQRIRALPEGPISVLNSPRWVVLLDTVGWFGIILGLLPSILILYMTPAMWMAYVAKTGLCMTLAFIPGFVRGCALIISEVWHWRSKFMEQADHDFGQFASIIQWLSSFDDSTLRAHRDFANRASQRLAVRVAFLAGDLNKLGILPALLGLFLLLKNAHSTDVEQVFETPPWLAALAIGLVIAYVFGMIGLRVRSVFQLHETLLSGALELKERNTIDPMGI